MPKNPNRQKRVYGPEIRRCLVEAILASGRPMKPVEIGKSAPDRPVPGTVVSELLSPDVTARVIFNWGSAKSPVYWHRDPEKVAEERLTKMAGAEPLVEADLIKRASSELPKLGLAALRSAKKRLLDSKRFRLEGPKEKKVIVDSEHPEAFLEKTISQLLQSFGRAPDAKKIRELLLGAGETGLPAENRIQDVAEKMFEAMRRIAFSPGATVTFYRLRQQPELADIPKAIFDRAALLLEADRKALLSVHDHASALPAEERERFVTDGLGTYYVSIYVR